MEASWKVPGSEETVRTAEPQGQGVAGSDPTSASRSGRGQGRGFHVRAERAHKIETSWCVKGRWPSQER